MIKRNWFVCLFTKYKYFMACNSKRKFNRVGTYFFVDINDVNIDGEVYIDYQGIEYIGDCKNCTRTKYYKENK